MSKILKIINQDKCIGCEMCVLECQQQLKTAGLEGSYIRILRNLSAGTKFVVSVDPKVEELNLKRIIRACPQDVFAEVEEHGV
jgi:NAD-dependent dihydropyrimidine dehydrogenase PreA subunit